MGHRLSSVTAPFYPSGRRARGAGRIVVPTREGGSVTELVQVLTALPGREEALGLAREVVEARLAACVQIVDGITSVYRWQGEVREESEALCVMKVPADRAAVLIDRVRARHPYETPEITSVPA